MRNSCAIAILVLTLCLASVANPAVAHADSFPSYGANEWDALKFLNKDRIKEFSLPLTMTAKLQQAADIRAGELKTAYSHTRPDGTPWDTVFSQVGLGVKPIHCWEHYIYGTSDAYATMAGWISSDDHVKMSQPEYIHVGMGCDSIYWVQILLSDGCSANGFSLDLPNKTLFYDANTKIEDFNITAVVDCSVHGASYMPLINEMCTGFNPSGTSQQTVTAHYGNLSATFTVYPKSLKISLPLPPRFSPIELPVWVWFKVTPKPWQAVKTLGPQPTLSATAPGPSPAPTPLETEADLPQRDELFPVIEVVPFFYLASPQPTVGID